MRVNRPVAGGLRVLPGLASGPVPETDAIAQLYWHREWVLRAGVPLLVLGEVHSAGERPVLRRPGRGPHVISTRTHAALCLRLAVSAAGAVALAAASGVAGAVVLLLHYV
jgi:hypothetical protein